MLASPAGAPASVQLPTPCAPHGSAGPGRPHSARCTESGEARGRGPREPMCCSAGCWGGGGPRPGDRNLAQAQADGARPGRGSHWLSNCCPQASLRPHDHQGSTCRPLRACSPGKPPQTKVSCHTRLGTPRSPSASPQGAEGAPAHPHHTPAALTAPQGLSKPLRREREGTAVLPWPGGLC